MEQLKHETENDYNGWDLIYQSPEFKHYLYIDVKFMGLAKLKQDWSSIVAFRTTCVYSKCWVIVMNPRNWRSTQIDWFAVGPNSKIFNKMVGLHSPNSIEMKPPHLFVNCFEISYTLVRRLGAREHLSSKERWSSQHPYKEGLGWQEDISQNRLPTWVVLSEVNLRVLEVKSLG